ncbi:7412_t:CDS:10 [Rhizophagus irregularis]|nr:7412_t:CDS:10 [Rhizophagus irregularis]
MSALSQHLYQIPSHLILNDDQKEQLKTLPGLYILQCFCGSDMTLKSSSTRKNRQMYTYVGCLAFARIKKNKDNNYMALDVKTIAINMLKAQVHPVVILEDNMKFIDLNLGGNVLIGNERFLLTSQDIINFRNSITKDIWGIDIRNSVEKNIHQIFETNNDKIIKNSTIFYKPKQSNQNRLMLVLATPEQKEMAWEYSHNKIIHFDRTFGFSNKKDLIICSFASGAQKASSSYNYSILKELLKQYKDKLSTEKNCEFLLKMKQMLGSYGSYDIISYRKDMKEYLNNNIKRIKIARNYEEIVNIELGWTYYGKLIAANILNVSIDSIPNTNNHLEAFNNQLKTHHLNRFQNEGYLLRLDVLSVLLIKNKLREQKAKTIIQEKQIINVKYTKDSLLLWIKSSESNQIGQKIYTKAFNSLDKKQTQELLLFEQELQEVYTGDLEDNIISIDKDSPTETIIPSTAQEYISSISNLLADLNDLITVENSMNRLT